MKGSKMQGGGTGTVPIVFGTEPLASKCLQKQQKIRAQLPLDVKTQRSIQHDSRTRTLYLAHNKIFLATQLQWKFQLSLRVTGRVKYIRFQ